MNWMLKTVAALTLVSLVAAVYWPIHHAGFVWDDVMCFHDAAWLRVGNDWEHFAFRGFCDWTNYFRPLLVALFTLQLRLFDSDPAPMHMVSLAIHVGNTLVVGALALRFCRARSAALAWPTCAVAACLYGLHPALLEPIVWINTQTELLVVFFMLAGLLLNAIISWTPMRAFAVAVCFFLAACSKESAIAFPLLLVMLDWLRDRGVAARTLWRRQRAVYAVVLLTGLVYLALRAWAFGYVIVRPADATTVALLPRTREIAYVFLTYMRILLWPMSGSGPIHVVDTARFGVASAGSWLAIAAMLAILALGLFGTWRRNLLGGATIAAFIALLPVLHVIPVAFDDSLFHERYVMMPLALLCSLVPAQILELRESIWTRGVVLLTASAAIAWLAVAIATIRTHIPVWSDEITLWSWALRSNPGSLTAQDRLLAAYMDRGELAHARALADTILAANTRCPFCVLYAAQLALADGNPDRAAPLLERIRNDPKILAYNQRFLQQFILVSGKLQEAWHDEAGAEADYHDAIDIDPLIPDPYLALALLLARQGRADEARAAATQAARLYAPDMRARHARDLERVLAAAGAAPP